jgi:hypothetical protein
MWRVFVCDQETSKRRKIKARYRAVENTTTMVCNARKTNRQTNKHILLIIIIGRILVLYIYIYIYI